MDTKKVMYIGEKSMTINVPNKNNKIKYILYLNVSIKLYITNKVKINSPTIPESWKSIENKVPIKKIT